MDLGALELEAAFEAMDHLMAGIVAITKDLLMQRLRLIHSITMAIITRAMGTITGCPIATTMDTTRGLLKLMQKQRLKLSTITLDITPRRVMDLRKVTAPLMVATTKGLLKRNPSSITTDMAIINLRAMAMDIRGEVSCPEISSPRSTITTTTTNEVLRIPAQIWSVER